MARPNWRPVPDLEGWEATPEGSIRRWGKELKPYWTGRTLNLHVGTNRLPPWVAPRKRGYAKRPAVSAARLVLLAHGGIPPDPNLVVGFKDDNPRNIAMSNLYWCSWQQAHGSWRRKT